MENKMKNLDNKKDAAVVHMASSLFVVTIF